MNFKSIVFIFFLFYPLLGHTEETKWAKVADEVGIKLKEGLALYEAGNLQGAKGKVTDAYFETFEGSGMESAVSLQISDKRKVEVETMFGNTRGAMTAGGAASEIKRRIDDLTASLEKDAQRMDKAAAKKGKAHPVHIFFDSFIIIVREGFEAILVISALITYLVKTGHDDKKKRIYLGAVLALAASFATAVILNLLVAVSGPAKEGLEGITMLTATAVLFYVSYWLISKAEVGRWQRFIKGKIEASLSGRSVFALSSAAFLAVYREGAETILFYQALLAGSNGHQDIVASGFITGAAVLTLIYVAIHYLSVRVPIGPFFGITSTLLYYLAFSFAGKGVLEIQEAGWLSSTPVNVPAIHILGIYPTLEGIALQGLLLLAAIGAGVFILFESYKGKNAVLGDVSHITRDIKALHELLEHIKEDIRKSKELWEPLREAEVSEIQEIKEHMDSLDTKAHEVMEHLFELEKGLTDIFSEMEKGIGK